MGDGDPVGQTQTGLSGECWRLFCDVVLAASHEQPEGFLTACRRYSQDLPLAEQRAGTLSLPYLLRGAILIRLGRAPTSEELAALSASAYPKVAVCLDIDPSSVKRTLFAAHNLASEDPDLTPGDFFVFGSAVLGALLPDPEANLDRLRTSLARWWITNAEGIDTVLGQPVEGD
jgi:hypothetical protein